MSTILEKIASIEAEVICSVSRRFDTLDDIFLGGVIAHRGFPLPDGPHPEEQGNFWALGFTEGETSQAQTRADHPEGWRRGWRARFRGRQDR